MNIDFYMELAIKAIVDFKYTEENDDLSQSQLSDNKSEDNNILKVPARNWSITSFLS